MNKNRDSVVYFWAIKNAAASCLNLVRICRGRRKVDHFPNSATTIPKTSGPCRQNSSKSQVVENRKRIKFLFICQSQTWVIKPAKMHKVFGDKNRKKSPTNLQVNKPQNWPQSIRGQSRDEYECECGKGRER